jgi:tetratricopeptide (TPR) repeat protein
MALECLGFTPQALLASKPEAAVYEAHHDQDGAVLLVLFGAQGARGEVEKRLPPDRVRSHPVPLPADPSLGGRKWGLAVMGPTRMALLANALWNWGRTSRNGGRQYCHDLASQLLRHEAHDLASQLVSHVMGGARGLRVGDKALEPREVKGSGYFSIALGARLVGAGAGAGGEADSDDVAVKVFLGQDSQAAFEAEVRTLRTLTAKLSPAALVVRLVGVVETSEGGALPWPALVMTPLCVESLEQRIDRFAREPYTLQEALAWAGQVALSLHRLHRESRLRHGDVSLRNVLLGRDGRAYLADMGVAEHNHPYGRQPQQEFEGKKGYSASVAPEMVLGGQGGAPADARADVWSWGVLLHALLTQSTATAKDGSVSAYLIMMEDGRWWEGAATLWGAEELPEGAFKAVKHSLCERGERVGLLAGAVLLGQQGLVEEMVETMEAPETVKKAELEIARLESRRIAVPQGPSSPAEGTSQAEVLRALAAHHKAVGDEARAIACLQQAARLFPDHTDDIKWAQTLNDLAVALSRRGDHKEAAALSEQALAMQRRLLPKDHPDIAKSLHNLATCHDSQGEYGKTALLHEEALAMRRRVLPEDHPVIATSLNKLARFHHSLGELGKAVPLEEEALAMERRLLAEDHPDMDEGGWVEPP